jgi:tRNA modification GTPase
MLALQPRHEAQLRAALSAVHAARQMLAGQIDSPQLQHVELIAGAMREALDHLAALGGQMTPDDVIGKIFATFCIGK